MGSIPSVSSLQSEANASVDVSDARILIVDDDPAMRLLCRGALESEGYDLFEANDGAEALELYPTLNPDLVMMDAMMPHVPGIAATKLIRDLPGGGDVPILIITGLDDAASVNRAFDVGATDFISKPINWAVLRQRVRRIIAAQRAKKQVFHLAYHDSLTGLPNRRLFLDHLGKACGRADRAGSKVAVVFIDLDNFKNINDRYGHDVGDAVLSTVGERLSCAVRDSDTVSRFGGDEFNMFIDDIQSIDDIPHIVESISRKLNQSIYVETLELDCSGSIGVAIFPDDAQELTALLKCADHAMFLAKKRGTGNHEYFQSSLGETGQKRILMESNLRALDVNEDLELYFQPRIDLKTNQIVAFEALLRWNHRDLGLIEASEFISIADDVGLSETVVKWVIVQALNELTAWRRSTPDIRTSINVSVNQLRSPNVVRFIHEELRVRELPASAIDIEISESNSHAFPQMIKDVIAELAELGCRITFDDFGTGSMSLLALQEMCVSAIKLDGELIKGIGQNEDRRTVCRAVLAMTRELDLRSIAEGIEDQATLDVLASIGCNEGQGYLCGYPLPAEETSKIIKSQAVRIEEGVL